MVRQLDNLPDDPVRLWEPTGEYVECIADRQSMNGRIGIDFTTWYETDGIAVPVYGIDPLIMSETMVDAAKDALDSGNPNPNRLLISPFCLACGRESAVWTVDFFLEPFLIWIGGNRVMVDRFGLGKDCIRLAAHIVGAERSRQKKQELIAAGGTT